MKKAISCLIILLAVFINSSFSSAGESEIRLIKDSVKYLYSPSDQQGQEGLDGIINYGTSNVNSKSNNNRTQNKCPQCNRSFPTEYKYCPFDKSELILNSQIGNSNESEVKNKSKISSPWNCAASWDPVSKAQTNIEVVARYIKSKYGLRIRIFPGQTLIKDHLLLQAIGNGTAEMGATSNLKSSKKSEVKNQVFIFSTNTASFVFNRESIISIPQYIFQDLLVQLEDHFSK
jgi:hypothetical protein